MDEDALSRKIARSGIDAARRKFTPEFMNRLDDVIVFHEYMRAYDGDFSEILDEPLPPE